MKNYEKLLATEITNNKEYLQKQKLFDNVKENWLEKQKRNKKNKKINNIMIICYILFISLIIALL